MLVRSVRHSFARFHRPAILLATLGLGACATIRPRSELGAVDAMVAQRSGQRVYWNQGTSADSEVTAKVSQLLRDTLTPDVAVQIALLNNQGLQATYEDLGIAQADLVQAGLLRNPIFSYSRRTPSGDIPSAVPNVEFGIVQSFLDLFQAPLRRRVAQAQLAGTRARVANAALDLSASVRDAFFSLQGAEQLVDLRSTTVRATAASYKAARAIHAAGNIPDLDLTSERALYQQSRVDLEQAIAAAVLARERLTGLMGMPRADSTWRVANRLPSIPAADPAPAPLESLAVAQRLDITASTQDIEAVARSAGLTRGISFLEDGTIGFDRERDVDGTTVRGPKASISIPIFDQGQAGRGIQRSRLRQAIERHNALVANVRSQVRTAQAMVRATRIREAYYRTVIVPLRHQVVEETQLQFNAMTLGVFALLQAKQAEIEAGRNLVEAQQDYWVARANLERAAGGRVPDSLFTETGLPLGPADTATDVMDMKSVTDTTVDSAAAGAMHPGMTAPMTMQMNMPGMKRDTVKGDTTMRGMRPGMVMPTTPHKTVQPKSNKASSKASPKQPMKRSKTPADTAHAMPPGMKMP